jgi:hypothetical protein
MDKCACPTIIDKKNVEKFIDIEILRERVF